MPLPGVREIELAGLKAWPAHEQEFDAGWVRRASGGYSKRANSVQSLDAADNANAAERLTAAAEWLAARGLPPVARVTPLAGPGFVEALDGAGWETFEPSLVLMADLADTQHEVDDKIEVSVPGGSEWLAAQQQLQGYDAHRLACLKGIVVQMAPPALGLVLRDAGGAPVASAYVAVVDRFAFLGSVVTDAAQRHRGLGRRLIQSALGLAREAGARYSTLQMLKSNAPAFGLYSGLGYRLRYEYHHRRPVAP